MYCQGCGAKNTDDARFCNMCGVSIAAVGAPGGPIAAPTQLGIGLAPAADPNAQNVPLAHARTVQGPALVSEAGQKRTAPPPDANHTGDLEAPSGYLPSAMNNTMSVSLEAIGVRSSRRTWGVIALASVALVAVGAGGMYLLEDHSAPEASSGGGAEPDDPFVIGTPVPEGEVLPNVDVVTGTNDVSAGGSAGGATTPSEGGATGTPAVTEGAGGAGAASGGAGAVTGGTTAGARSGGSTAGGTGGNGETSGTGSSGSMASAGSTGTTGSAGSTGGTGGGSADPQPSGEPAGGGGGGSVDPGPGSDEAPASRDIEMDMYSGRVRFLISRYYAARAQTCWDRATRTDSTISGTVTIAMTIGPDGAVTAARVARNSTGDANLGTCLQNEVRQWRLSPPPGGESVTMNLPFSR